MKPILIVAVGCEKNERIIQSVLARACMDSVVVEQPSDSTVSYAPAPFAVPEYKYSYRELTTLHGVRYKLAKRNCKGRARTGRVFNGTLLYKLGWLRRADSMRSFNFIKWDKVNVLPNHFLGGRRS